MIIEILSFTFDETELFDKAINIRFSVFSDEQGVDKDIEYDGLDSDAFHYLLTIDGIPAVTARWRKTDDGIKIERMAVMKKYRGMFYGALLFKQILVELKSSERQIYLHSQSAVVDFYKKFGFFIEGDEFVEADIKHFKMILKK